MDLHNHEKDELNKILFSVFQSETDSVHSGGGGVIIEPGKVETIPEDDDYDEQPTTSSAETERRMSGEVERRTNEAEPEGTGRVSSYSEASATELQALI